MKELQTIGFTNCALVKDDIWFCDIYHSYLLKMHLNTGEISLEAALLSENLGGRMQYGPIVYVNGKIILAPRNANDILIYDRHTKATVRLELKDRNKKLRKPLFLSGFVYGGNAFFLPGNYPAIIKVNGENMSVEYFEDFYNDLPEEIRRRNGILCNSNALIIDKYCIFPIFDSGIFIKVDLDFSCYEIKWVSESKYKILSMAYIDGNIWFAGQGGLFILSEKEKRVICYNKYLPQDQLGNGIGQIIDYKKRLVIIPVNGKNIIWFNPKKYECIKFDNYTMPLLPGDNGKYVLTGSNIICCNKLKGGVLCIFSTFTNEICLINLTNHLVQRYSGRLKKQDTDQIIEVYIKHNRIINETDVRLNDYIRYVNRAKV